MIPHQPLLGNSISKHHLQDQFIRGFHSFLGWLLSSFSNVAFILLLVIASVAFPFLMQGVWPKFRKNIQQMPMSKDFVLPCLGVIAVFPMFFVAAGSLRYLIFPAIILIVCIVLAYLRLMGRVKDNRGRVAIVFLWGCFICFGTFFIDKKVKTEPAYKSNAAKIYQCIKCASLEYPLQDGIASYWNARPIKFYSNFEYYLAQTSPWAPKDGYYHWGNNWYEFLYKNSSTKSLRKYNYIIATSDEIKLGLWGNVINKSKDKMTYEDYTLFYFGKDDILWDFLFFRGAPSYLHKLDPEIPWERPCLSNSGPCVFTGDDDELSTLAGVREGAVIKANGKAGFLVYGPYISLEPGEYRLVGKGELYGQAKVLGTIEVAADLGKRILAVKSIVAGQNATGDIVSLDFKIEKPVNNVEFRINILAQTSGYFKAYELTQVGSHSSRRKQ